MLKRPLIQLSKASRFLLSIGENFEFFQQAIQSPSNSLKYGRDFSEIKFAIERADQKRILLQLHKRQMLKVRKVQENNAQRYLIALTNQGRAELLRLGVLNADLLPQGKNCLVVFDIPEQHRNLREQIRKLLKAAGFFPIQRSVWISPFDAGPALIALFALKKARSWVRAYYVKEIDRESFSGRSSTK